jgi:hypothetical protein
MALVWFFFVLGGRSRRRRSRFGRGGLNGGRRRFTGRVQGFFRGGRGGRPNFDVGLQFVEAGAGDAGDDHEVFDFVEGGFDAKFDDGGGAGGADAGEFFELTNGSGVEVEGLGRRRFLGLRGD